MSTASAAGDASTASVCFESGDVFAGASCAIHEMINDHHDGLSVRSFRLSDEFMTSLDAWIAQQDDQPSRAEAIRRLVELGLKVKK